MKKIFFSLIFIAISIPKILFSQSSAIELTFTASMNSEYIRLDSIYIENLTQSCDTMLYWPDTVLVLGANAVDEKNMFTNTHFKVFRNFPNPADGQTSLMIYVPDEGLVELYITDIFGRTLATMKQKFCAGHHKVIFFTGREEIYIFSAVWNSITIGIPIVNLNFSLRNSCKLEYGGLEGAPVILRSQLEVKKFMYSIGDQLLMMGYTGTLESGMAASPLSDVTYIFQFATHVPCPGLPAITYEDQVYNTVQIFSQCWMKENLNVGIMIPDNETMENNGVIEKYCYGNNQDNCDIYGGLYRWDEVMQYTTTGGIQGICPAGWHIPTDADWKVLEGFADSYYGAGDPVWDILGWRGFDCGKNLKSLTGWFNGQNGTDLFGFTSLPGGYWSGEMSFVDLFQTTKYWTSSTYDNIYPILRGIFYYGPDMYHGYNVAPAAYMVRCLKDN